MKLEERRVSVIALRADAFVETVADVTTGDTMSAGAPMVTPHAPTVASDVAPFISDVRAEGPRRDGARPRLENLGAPVVQVPDGAVIDTGDRQASQAP